MMNEKEAHVLVVDLNGLRDMESIIFCEVNGTPSRSRGSYETQSFNTMFHVASRYVEYTVCAFTKLSP
jgi:hypothetical protein